MDMSPHRSIRNSPQPKPADRTQIRSNRAQRRARRALERNGAGPMGIRVRRATALTPAQDVQDEADAASRYLQQAMMLDWLGQPPLSFHRVFVNITGNVLAALWLSHALDRRGEAGNFGEPPLQGDFIFQMTAAQCEEETGITRAQQITCRRVLADKGLLSEQGSQGKTLRYRIHKARLLQCLLEQAAPLAQVLRQTGEVELAAKVRASRGRGNAQGPAELC